MAAECLHYTKDYRFESVRLESFKGWPCSWMKPEKLAASGFYYTGKRDIVRCFECSIEMYDWQEGGDPIAAHRQSSRECKFICNPCDNVSIGTDLSTIPALVPTIYSEIDGPYYSAPVCTHSNSDTKGRMSCMVTKLASKPRHPGYANYTTRLESYDRWPIATSPTKEDLARAGFFYTGSSDQTLCHHCGGALRDWKPNDDPWIEHAKLGYCPYLLLNKGLEFMMNIGLQMEFNIPSAINTLNEEFNIEKKAECIASESIANESIASGSSQNSINSEEINFNNTASAVANEASSEAQSVQAQGDKPCDKDARLCKICFNREMRIVFMPCRHLLACAECAKDMKICSVCRKNVESTVQVYIS